MPVLLRGWFMRWRLPLWSGILLQEPVKIFSFLTQTNSGRQSKLGKFNNFLLIFYEGIPWFSDGQPDSLKPTIKSKYHRNVKSLKQPCLIFSLVEAAEKGRQMWLLFCNTTCVELSSTSNIAITQSINSPYIPNTRLATSRSEPSHSHTLFIFHPPLTHKTPVKISINSFRQKWQDAL